VYAKGMAQRAQNKGVRQMRYLAGQSNTMLWHAVEDATDNFRGVTKAMCGALVATQREYLDDVVAKLWYENHIFASQDVECEKCEKKLTALKANA